MKVYDYRNKDNKYSVDEFIQIVKVHPLEFISYCEVVIDKEGYIHLCIPSHQQTLLRISKYSTLEDLCDDLENCTNKSLIEATEAISVYYGIQEYVKMNPIQRQVLNRLNHANIINLNLHRIM